jgi:hypothetical protein
MNGEQPDPEHRTIWSGGEVSRSARYQRHADRDRHDVLRERQHEDQRGGARNSQVYALRRCW